MSTKHKFQGLSDEEVIISRQTYGDNVVTPKKDDSAWQLFVSKFEDPIIRILFVLLAAAIGIAVYEATRGLKGWNVLLEPTGIFVAIALAIGVGFVFELRAKREFDLLNAVSDDDEVKVMRAGKIRNVLRRDIVVGDIIYLETGEEVPADGCLLESVSLMVNESSLTGEPMVHKSHRQEDADNEATYNTANLLRSSTIMEGHCVMSVTAVGDKTDYGKVFEASHIDNGIETPLNRQLYSLSLRITRLSYIIASVVLLARFLFYFVSIDDFIWMHFMYYTVQTILLALTVVVVAVPEGLPMSVTLSLALSMRQMFKSGNLVRKMHACETMGATSVICTDKTGTLTENKMQVSEAIFCDDTDRGSMIVAEAIAVNTTAHLDLTDETKPIVLGNPTEGALLLYLQKRYGKLSEPYYLYIRENRSVVGQKPFNNVDKYMLTMVHSPLFDGQRVLYIKGAPEILLGLCNEPTGQYNRKQIEEKLGLYQSMAMRTLALAYRVLDRDESLDEHGLPKTNKAFNFLGIVAIEDPVRVEVPEAVKLCQQAGIHIKMVTGDTPGTAKEIAKRVGIWDDNAGDEQLIEGSAFASLSDEEAQERITEIRLMSRAKPLDKARLVRLLTDQGKVVAVTGDGSNDAPAMNAAHIGLSMGDGTSVAKQASDITILDNSFSTISSSVMWGRSVYINIQRFILFQLTINLAACIIVLIGALIGTDSPLTVTQMLWVNLIMDTFAAMALASLPPSNEVMKMSPRAPEHFIISKTMGKRIVSYGVGFVIILFFFFQYLRHYDLTSLTDFSFRDFVTAAIDFRIPKINAGITAYELSLFFTVFVMLQFWNMFNARTFLSNHSALHRLLDCRGFLLISLCIFAGQVIITSFGGDMFGVRPLSLTDWITITLSTSLVLWIGEFLRWRKRRSMKRLRV